MELSPDDPVVRAKRFLLNVNVMYNILTIIKKYYEALKQEYTN